jgi:hypothetical protein
VDVKEGGAPKSQGVSGEGECVRLCWCPRKVQESYLLVSCTVLLCWLFSFFRLPRMIPTCPFYRLKEVQGYKMLACGVTLLVEEPRGLGRALSGDDVVRTVETWRQYLWHCYYVFWHVCHC